MVNRLDVERSALLLHCLVEGNSCRGTSRLTEVDINTVYRWLDRAALACADFHDERVRGLNLHSLQADELWGFVYVKSKRVDTAKASPAFAGDVWTWLALDPHTKLIISCYVGSRGVEDATAFMKDLADRLDGRIQLTTDGHSAYLEAVESAFGGNIDFAQLVKAHVDDDGRELTETLKRVVSGSPIKSLISTSLVERLNRTVRMSNRRLIRRTDGFSKRVRRHAAMMQVLVTHYNFCRPHRALQTTPAVAAGLADRVWDRRQLVQIVIEHSGTGGPRGPYRCKELNSGSGGVLSRHWGRARAVREGVTCTHCGSHWMPKDGLDGTRRQRYRCGDCGYRSVGAVSVP